MLAVVKEVYKEFRSADHLFLLVSRHNLFIEDPLEKLNKCVRYGNQEIVIEQNVYMCFLIYQCIKEKISITHLLHQMDELCKEFVFICLKKLRS